MKIVVWNVRGFGERLKRAAVRDLIRKERPCVVGVIESQLERVNHGQMCGCWGHTRFEWAALPSIGRSGGVIVMWDTNLSQVIYFLGSGG